MAVAFRSYGESPGASLTECVIVKPVGLAIDDIMIANMIWYTSVTISSPGGTWTVISNSRMGYFWKKATAGDVAAASFTFTATRE